MNDSPSKSLLSVVIPVFNERYTLSRVLGAVGSALVTVPKQIVIVDDGSTDGTREWLRATFPGDNMRGVGLAIDGDAVSMSPADVSDAPSIEITVVYHERNWGKGRAIRTGFDRAAGDIIVIQDADLEYDPQDLVRMFDLIANRGVADVVFGCRFYGSPHRSLFFVHYLANRLISTIFNILYNQTLKDIEVCYKMMRREVLSSFALTCDDFGIEVELSAKIARARHWRIYEVGISYFGRTYAEGKKINWKDGIRALWYLLKFRLA